MGRFLGRHPVVLLFFPLSFSSVCTSELCAVRDAWDGFEALDAKVFGISVDSPFVAARFRSELSLPFPLLSDFNREVSGRFGVLYEEPFFGLRGVARRAAFVIGSDRVVRLAWVSDDSDVEPDYEAIRAAIRRAG